MVADRDDKRDSKFGRRLAHTAKGRVVLHKCVEAFFDALEERVRGRFVRIMELWCDDRPLTEKMINRNEGRAPRTNTMCQAFKAFKVRLYGHVGTEEDQKCFVITDFDPAKKQDKADKVILKRAKGRIDNLVEGKEI
jgi:hypothetical protein